MPSLLGVELARAGTFDLVTGGRRTFRVEDFHDAVDASAEFGPARIRPGHTDPRFDGEPALGRVDNLRVVGDRLVGDLVDLPDWMASSRGRSAYPNRSIEGYSNVTSETGRRYRLVLTSLAMLGVTPPAIDGLASLPAAVAAGSRLVAAAAAMDLTEPDPDEDPGALAQAVDAILDQAQEALAAGDVATAVALVTGAETSIDALLALLGVPDADDVPNGPAAAAAGTSARRRNTPVIVVPTESRQGAAGMDHAAELRRVLGLAEDASDEDVQAALAARPAPTAEPEPTPAPEPTAVTEPTPPATPEPPAGVVVPPGFRLVAEGVWDEVQSGLAESLAAARAYTTQQENEFITRNRSRIGAAGNPHAQVTEAHLRREWQRNPGEAEAFAAALPERIPTAPAGHGGGPETGDSAEDALYAALFGKDA